MPGEQIDKIVNEYIAKLDFEAPKGEALLKLPKEEQRELTKRADTAYGTEIFKQIDALRIPEADKQEIFQRLGQHVVKKGIDEATDATTLLRTDNKGTNFMTAYMNKFAEGYYNAVVDKTTTAIKGTKLPTDDPGFPKAFPKPGTDTTNNPTLKPETLTKMDDVYTDLGKVVVDATISEAHKMSPHAQKFLQSISDTARDMGRPEMVSNLMASTMILRGVGPKMVNNAAKSTDSIHKNLMLNSSVVLQSFANTVDLESPNMSKPQFKIVDRLRNPESIGGTLKLFNATSQGADLSLPGKVQQMEKDLTSRKQGGFINWIKSIPDGGPQKAIAKLSEKIETGKKLIEEQNDPVKYAEKRGGPKVEKQGMKSESIESPKQGMDVSTTTKVSAPQVKKLREELNGKIQMSPMKGAPSKKEGVESPGDHSVRGTTGIDTSKKPTLSPTRKVGTGAPG
jgi:hypothetical protein